jgi:hypothetical protein
MTVDALASVLSRLTALEAVVSGSAIMSAPLVLTPGFPAQITANNTNVAHGDKSYLRITSDAARSNNGLAAGTYDGQVCWLHNVGAFNISFSDQDTVGGTLLQLETQPTTMTPNDTLGLIWNNTAGYWYNMASRTAI